MVKSDTAAVEVNVKTLCTGWFAVNIASPQIKLPPSQSSFVVPESKAIQRPRIRQ